jgi:tripartite-type tricarboxylate transporter receptor subunit TctC
VNDGISKFVVENRPGAAGIIGSKAVIGSAPDGCGPNTKPIGAGMYYLRRALTIDGDRLDG